MESQKSFMELAAIEWKMLTDAVEKARQGLAGDEVPQIRLEDICSDPVGVFRSVIQFGELEWPPEFERSIRRSKLINANCKWQRELTPEQRASIQDVLGDHLARYDYQHAMCSPVML